MGQWYSIRVIYKTKRPTLEEQIPAIKDLILSKKVLTLIA